MQNVSESYEAEMYKTNTTQILNNIACIGIMFPLGQVWPWPLTYGHI